MDVWLQWAKGPLFWTALAFMIFGLLRHLVLTLWEGAQAYRRAGDKNFPVGKLVGTTFSWLFPLGRLRNRALFSLTTVLFHVGVILVPLFLAGHIKLWREGVGLSWPAA